MCPVRQKQRLVAARALLLGTPGAPISSMSTPAQKRGVIAARSMLVTTQGVVTVTISCIMEVLGTLMMMMRTPEALLVTNTDSRGRGITSGGSTTVMHLTQVMSMVTLMVTPPMHRPDHTPAGAGMLGRVMVMMTRLQGTGMAVMGMTQMGKAAMGPGGVLLEGAAVLPKVVMQGIMGTPAASTTTTVSMAPACLSHQALVGCLQMQSIMRIQGAPRSTAGGEASHAHAATGGLLAVCLVMMMGSHTGGRRGMQAVHPTEQAGVMMSCRDQRQKEHTAAVAGGARHHVRGATAAV
jgi:hypothetical protein